MNENNKRFVYMDLLETEAISVSDDECYYFNEYGTVQKICEILNELHEENQMLKEQYADDCNEANSMTVKIAELTEENEQLKQEINILKTTIGRNEAYIQRITLKGEWK